MGQNDSKDKRLDLNNLFGEAQTKKDGTDTVRQAEIEDVTILSALAMLDLQAATTYEAVANSCDVPTLASKLKEFAADHGRHVAELNGAIRERGGTPVERLSAGQDLLTSIAALSAPLGALAQVTMLLTNEQLTNGTYELALAYEWEDDVQRIIDGAMEDEQRHLDWLADQEDVLSREEDEVPASSLS